MFRNIAFKILWNISYRIGFDLRDKNQSSTPLKTYGNDPRELLYIQHLPYAVLQLPIELGVGLRFYSFVGKTYHPFVLALSKVDTKKKREAIVFEVLEKFCRLMTLNNPNDYLGLDESERCFSTDIHPLEYTFPWSLAMPLEVKEKALEDLREENARYGLASEESLELNLASDEKIRSEVTRLINLKTSIEENGFKENCSDPLGCFVLVKGGEWKWCVRGGQHRAAVMAALGYTQIPVFVRRIIKREDVSFWPNVKSGLYTEKQALTVFDKFFDAKPPSVAKDWVDYVDKTFYNNKLKSS